METPVTWSVPLTKSVLLHKIASSTAGKVRNRAVLVVDEGPVGPGTVVVVEALEEKSVYGEIELEAGRMAKIKKGDLIAGAIGARQALRGFVGHAPASVKAGETLAILNMGGVIGCPSSAARDFGEPLKVKVHGIAVDPDTGEAIHIASGAIPAAKSLSGTGTGTGAGACTMPPIVLVAGTCMSSGKTRAACEIVAELTRRGMKIGALKLSGIACLRDTLAMQDHGAALTLSFLDAGLPSTAGVSDLAPMAKGILRAMVAGKTPALDAIVIEMGDGIVGGYGVASIYEDAEIMGFVKAHVMCANDLVAAWGAKEIASKMLGRRIDVMSGPATDNEVGERYVEDELGIPAANARVDGAKLADAVEAAIGAGAKSAVPRLAEAMAAAGDDGSSAPAEACFARTFLEVA